MLNHYSSQNLRPLDDEQLRAVAPSVFASQAWNGVSEKYSFLPTSAVVSRMRENRRPITRNNNGPGVPGRAAENSTSAAHPPGANSAEKIAWFFSRVGPQMSNPSSYPGLHENKK